MNKRKLKLILFYSFLVIVYFIILPCWATSVYMGVTERNDFGWAVSFFLLSWVILFGFACFIVLIMYIFLWLKLWLTDKDYWPIEVDNALETVNIGDFLEGKKIDKRKKEELEQLKGGLSILRKEKTK